jgi:hypothetical protein
MGRYESNIVENDTGSDGKIHPIWRGIGCIIVILLPAMSYAGAVELVKANYFQGWIRMPIELTGPPQFPYLYAYLLVGTMLLLIGSSLLITLYSLIYRVATGPRQGPLDASPEWRRKKKKYN